MAGQETRPLVVGDAVLFGLEVTHAGVGVHHHARTDDVGTPAQVERLAVRGDLGIEAVERVEQVDAHEQAGLGDHEHVAHRVVLLLVELPGLDQRHEHPGLVRTHAHGEQTEGVVPFDELRADDAGVRAEGLLDELADGRWLERDIVVEEAEEPRSLDEPQRLVGRRAEPGPLLEPAHICRGQMGGNGRGEVRISRRGVHDEDGQVRVVLGGQGGEQLVERGARVVGHQHSDDRRRRLRLGLHNGLRLAAEPSPARALQPCAVDHKCLQLFNSTGSVVSTSPQPIPANKEERCPPPPPASRRSPSR